MSNMKDMQIDKFGDIGECESVRTYAAWTAVCS